MEYKKRGKMYIQKRVMEYKKRGIHIKKRNGVQEKKERTGWRKIGQENNLKRSKRRKI